MTLQNDCNKNHENLDLNTNTNRSKLQKAWSQFEEILSKAAKATIKTKKVKGISKYNLPKRNCFKEISELLSSLKLLCTLIKACTNTDWEKIKALKKNIISYNLKHPDTNLNDINLNCSQKDIPWNVWTGLIKSRYLLLRDVCYKVEQQNKRKQIKIAIKQRFSDLKDNQKRMISSLTNRFKDTITIDRILVQNCSNNQEKYISIDPETVKTQVTEYYKTALGKRNANLTN